MKESGIIIIMVRILMIRVQVESLENRSDETHTQDDVMRESSLISEQNDAENKASNDDGNKK